MRKILIIGMGAGHPEHITIQAINALRRVDVLFVTDKGAAKEDLAALRHEICTSLRSVGGLCRITER